MIDELRKQISEEYDRQTQEIAQIDTKWMQRMFTVYMSAGDPKSGAIAVCRQCDPSDMALQYSTVSRITALLDKNLLFHKRMKGWIHVMPVGVLVHEFVFEIASRAPVDDTAPDLTAHFDVDYFVRDLHEAAEQYGVAPVEFDKLQIPGLEIKRSLWWKFKRLFMSPMKPRRKKAGTMKKERSES